MPIFIDLMYPDNKNRKTRLDELMFDCNTMMTEAVLTKDRATEMIENTNEVIKNAYSGIGQTPPKIQNVSILNDLTIAITETIFGVISIPLAISALKWSFTNYLLSQGRITAEQVVEIGAANLIKMEIPSFFRIGGNMGAMIIVTFAIEALIDSIEGAVQRSELKDGIKQTFDLRRPMKKAEEINYQILTTAQSVITTYNTMVELGFYTAEQLKKAAEILVEKNKINIDEYTDAKLNSLLKELDAGRKSWTNEDPKTDNETEEFTIPKDTVKRIVNYDQNHLEHNARIMAYDTLQQIGFAETHGEKFYHYFKNLGL